METIQLLVNISLATALLPIIAAIANYKNLDKTLKLLSIFFIISGLFDLLLWLLKLTRKFDEHNNDYPLLHLFIIINIAFYAIVYYRSFYSKQLKNITVLMSVLALTAVVFFSVRDSIWTYPSTSMTVLSMFLIPLSLLYFYQLLNRQEFIHIENQPLFWINSGVLIYFSFNIFLFMLLSRISKPSFYMIHSVTNIIANLFFAIGLFCKPRKIT